MHLTDIEFYSDGWTRFNLNVAGFAIRNCSWHQPTRRIFFPIRYGIRAELAKTVLRQPKQPVRKPSD